ncbi:hypothetical protein F4804DRAFT_348210 [Jackrogersella minutella]|nr:hypothetical protein F4804DRAFT_348210 [Jackrogersella minutella]
MWDDSHYECVRYTHVFLSLGPLWLFLFLTLAPYANDYKFCWLSLMAPQDTDLGFDNPVNPGHWYLGLCLVLVSACLKVNWFGSLLQILITTRLCDRHWKPPKNPSSKRIMQADPAEWDTALPGGRLVYHEGRRPRRCPFGCDFDLSDRMYHCTAMRRCFPVYDDYCKHLRSTVYLRTMKPYCFVLFFLPLDAIYSFAVSLVAICQFYTRWTVPFVGSIVSCSLAVTFFLLINSPANLKRLVWENCVGPELDGGQWTLAFKYQERLGPRLRLHDFEKNPWDLGPKENFRQVFGQHWWMWLFFWWTPERVSQYGSYVDRDLPYADYVIRRLSEDIMERMTSVSIDLPVPSSIHEGGPSRRQSTLPDTDHHSQRRSNNTSTSHVDVFIRHQRGDRRQTQGHSSSHDLGV